MLQQQQGRGSGGVDLEFNQECIDSHNDFRALHGCPPLKMSNDLASEAQKWAEHLASTRAMKHSQSNGKYGENIAMKMVQGSSEYTGHQATSQWYSEIEDYDFDGPENQMRCGHFSQVVWKGTTEAGFGKAIAADGKLFAVGQYRPPGNFMNEWKRNIPRPSTIKVPSQEDIMGKRPPPTKISTGAVQSKTPLQANRQLPQGNISGGLKQVSGSGQSSTDPEPRDPKDRMVKKHTKKQMINGKTTVTVEAVFLRPDGSKYQSVKETTTGADDQGMTQRPSHGLQDRLHDPMVNKMGQDFEAIRVVKKKRVFAAPPSGESAAGDRSSFSHEVIAVHNNLREQHNAGILIRSDSLSNLAQDWADELSKRQELQHHTKLRYNGCIVGQNISKRDDSDPRASGTDMATELVYQWYSEAEEFFQLNPNLYRDDVTLNGGHFTQIAWKNTRQIGIGISSNENTKETYVVCFYYPPGNVENDFASNVSAKR